MKYLHLLATLLLLLLFHTNAFPLPEGEVGNGFNFKQLDDLNGIDYNLVNNGNLIPRLTENITIDLAQSSDSNNEHVPKKKSLMLLITFCVVGLLSILANARAFYIVFLKSKRKSRPANILVAHSSFVVIMFIFNCYIYTLEKSKVFNTSAPGLCIALTFMRNGFFYVLPLNTVAIVWVRVTDDAIILRKSVAYRIIVVTWIITLLSNLPSIWMMKYVTSSDTKNGECREVELFGSFEATAAFCIFRFFVFNALVSFYLIRAAIKIRSVIKYLQANKLVNRKIIQRRTKQAQHVYFQTMLFVSNWIPLGVVVFVYQLFNRSSWKDTYFPYLTPFVIIYFNIIILSPLSYVYFVENLSIVEIIAPCFSPKGRRNVPTDQATSEQNNPEKPENKRNLQFKRRSNTGLQKQPAKENRNKKPEESFLTSEMSRISTFGVTEFSGSRNNSMANIRPLSPSFFVQGPSNPARGTRATYCPKKKVTVEVHSEANQPNNEDETLLCKGDSETLV